MNKDLFPQIEGFNVFGEPLIQSPLSQEVKDKLEKQFKEALTKFEKNPNNSNNIIWLGRRTAYLGRFRDAISIFSRGIKQFSDDPRMYRHRGHRFLTLRYFNLAYEDFKKASQLIKGRDDQVEPDGVPNSRGIPVSTLHSNIWYHLGLAAYLLGKLNNAKDAYETCIKVSKLDDNYVSTGYWLYMTLLLLEQEKEAKKVLTKVSKEMDIIENFHYHKLLLMYKGQKEPEELLKNARDEGPMSLATIGYGIANWYLYKKEKEKAREILIEIHSLDVWASFGCIAAEVTLKQLEKK